MDDKDSDLTSKKKMDGLKANAARPPEVIVYSMPSCPYCTMAKSYLEGKGVKFVEYDVSNDKKRATEMVRASGQNAVPVLQINGRIVIGFDRQLIDDALARKKPPTREELMTNLSFDPFNI